MLQRPDLSPFSSGVFSLIFPKICVVLLVFSEEPKGRCRVPEEVAEEAQGCPWVLAPVRLPFVRSSICAALRRARGACAGEALQSLVKMAFKNLSRCTLIFCLFSVRSAFVLLLL